MRTTAPAPEAPQISEAGHVDVLIVGAGVSGIGAAHHLRDRFPDRTFVILDAQDNRGGTWWTHRYPGVRSDSDLFTYGYRFKPWRGPSIAAGAEILDYLDEVVEDDDLEQHIRCHHRVTAARWSGADRRWTVEVTRTDSGERLRFTTDFLWMCQGYYNHEKPYQPRWQGMERFQGRIVHPQQWPDDLDYTGKRVVVIGSGSTASTLVPAMAKTAAHVTMLQRSPSYYVAAPTTHELAVMLQPLDIPQEWMHEILLRQYLMQYHWLATNSLTAPDEVHAFLMEGIRPLLPEGYDIDKPRTTARGSSASRSFPTVISSPPSAKERRRSSPTRSRSSPRTASASARARSSKPTSWSPRPGSTWRCSATSRSPSTARRSTSPSASRGAV